MSLESNVYALYGAKQTAKGTPATTATKRFIQVGGDFNVNRDDASENWSDLDRFGGATDWVNTLIGSGNPAIEATPDETAWLCWLFFGGEVVTGTTPNFEHAFTPNTVGGFWSTWWQRVGATQIRREKFNDCKIGSLAITGSTGAKACRITPTITSLDPGEKFTSDPVIDMPGDQRVFLYTEGSSSFTIDGVVITGQSQFTVTWNDALAPIYGDSNRPIDLVPGNAVIDLAVTLQVDANGLAQYNKIIYGTAAPADGAKPIATLPSIGSWSCDLEKDANTGLAIEVPGVKWSPDLALPPNPDGGAVELSLAGQMRKVTGEEASTVTVKNAAEAYTA